jgi:hypothetical protein
MKILKVKKWLENRTPQFQAISVHKVNGRVTTVRRLKDEIYFSAMAYPCSNLKMPGLIYLLDFHSDCIHVDYRITSNGESHNGTCPINDFKMIYSESGGLPWLILLH